MKKSICLYYNKNINQKEKLLNIKRAGFDEFFDDVIDSGEDLALGEQVKYASSIGLKCTMIHCAYDESKLPYFWEDGTIGDNVCDAYMEQIKICKGLTANFVVHLTGNRDQKYTEFGLKRIKKLLDVCEQCDINLCVENLYSDKEIPYIFENIEHKRLKICYDTGHQNFLTPNFNILKYYLQFISVVHLHDNDGTCDSHSVCGCGSIDWKPIAKYLAAIPGIVLSSEAKCCGQDEKEFLNEVYKSLGKIDKYCNGYAIKNHTGY